MGALDDKSIATLSDGNSSNGCFSNCLLYTFHMGFALLIDSMITQFLFVFFKTFCYFLFAYEPYSDVNLVAYVDDGGEG